MKKINTIVVLDDDDYFLALLNGYCFAGNISLQVFDYDKKGIREAGRLKPDVIVVSLESVSTVRKKLETDLLKEVRELGKIKLIALNRGSFYCKPDESLEWIDVVIKNPHDLSEIDAYLKTMSSLANPSLTKSVAFPDNRSGFDRREIKIKVNGDITYSNRRSNSDRRTWVERRNNFEINQPKDCSDKLFYIDQRCKCLYVKGHKIELTPKEFELLLFLSTDMERVFTADEIINHLWPESHRATKSDLYQYMHLLRKKIEIDPNSPQWIRNIKGFGYKLEIAHS